MPSSALFDTVRIFGRTDAFGAGKVLFRRGDTGSAVYVIHSGRVVLIWSGRRKVVPMDVLGPGAVLNLPAAFNVTCSVTAKTIESCELSLIPASLLMDLLQCDPKLLQAATSVLGQEVARARTLLFPPAERNAQERLPQVAPEAGADDPRGNPGLRVIG